MKRKKAKVETELRRSNDESRNYRSHFFLLPFAFFLICSCVDKKQPTSRPMTMRERQDAALHDPFGYKADDVPTVSGGKTGDFDKKGFDRDVDHVLNP